MNPDKPTIDWPEFISQHDMHFSKLHSRWQEAPHFGNAMPASILYQQHNAICLLPEES